MSDLLPKLRPLFTSCVALRDSGVLGAMKQQAFWRRVPEGNLEKPQPFYRLCKLAKGSAREHGDVRAYFTHARYASSQKAMHDTNNKQQTNNKQLCCLFVLLTVMKLLRHQNVDLLQHYCDQWRCRVLMRLRHLVCCLVCTHDMSLHCQLLAGRFRLFVYMQIYFEDTIKGLSFSCSFHLNVA